MTKFPGGKIGQVIAIYLVYLFSIFVLYVVSLSIGAFVHFQLGNKFHDIQDWSSRYSWMIFTAIKLFCTFQLYRYWQISMKNFWDLLRPWLRPGHALSPLFLVVTIGYYFSFFLMGKFVYLHDGPLKMSTLGWQLLLSGLFYFCDVLLAYLLAIKLVRSSANVSWQKFYLLIFIFNFLQSVFYLALELGPLELVGHQMVFFSLAFILGIRDELYIGTVVCLVLFLGILPSVLIGVGPQLGPQSSLISFKEPLPFAFYASTILSLSLYLSLMNYRIKKGNKYGL